MVCLRLLQIVLLVLMESYLYLQISYYQYFLKVVLHHNRKPLEGDCLPLCNFLMLLSFMVLILSWLANELQIISHYFPCNGWFSSAKAFYDIYVVVIEIENSYITSVTILFFSVNITPAFSWNLLFVRNGLINFRNSLFVWTPFFVTLLK